MSEKCGNCGSHNLGPDDWDLWHYMKNCNNCGARTRYNRKGEILTVRKNFIPVKKENNFYSSIENKWDWPSSLGSKDNLWSGEDLKKLKEKGERFERAWWTEQAINKLKRGY